MISDSSPSHQISPVPTGALAKISSQLLLGLFILAVIFEGVSLLVQTGVNPGTSETLLILSAVVSTLFSQTRQLPVQNVLLAGGIIAFISTVVCWIGVTTNIPFGPFYYSDDIGPRFKGVPWITPFIWLLAVLNSRGVARLILRPWRKTRTYGWWVIGVTIVLCLFMDLGWEMFATQVKHYVVWGQTRIPVSWYGVPLINFLGWILTLLLILAFATPALINKNPSRTRSRPDYHPLVVWLLLNSIFVTGAATHRLWTAVIVAAIYIATATVFALRGARW